MNDSILNFPDYECDDFVRRKADAKLCQMPAWINMVEKVFGHKGFYLVAREGGTVCGALPLTHVRSKLFGSRMIFQAFSNYGGPLAKSPVVSNALCKSLSNLQRKYTISGASQIFAERWAGRLVRKPCENIPRKKLTNV